MAEPTPDKVKYVFTYEPEFRICAANGMWGGVTPKGDLRLDFFVESFDPPVSQTLQITPGGQVGAEIERRLSEDTPNAAVVTRRVQVAVLVPGSQVDSWATFLTEKANELKGLTRGKE